tara:strand:+ start:47 stop:352 length:306 start_codon:yes stop_codon:yes gene_type:complete
MDLQPTVTKSEIIGYLWRVAGCQKERQERHASAIRRVVAGDLGGLEEIDAIYTEAETQVGLAVWLAETAAHDVTRPPPRIIGWWGRVILAYQCLRYGYPRR